MSELVNAINQEAAQKKAADRQAAAVAKAQAEAPPLEVVNIRNIRPAGSLLFMPTPGSPGFELKLGDNLIDAAKITPAVQVQLVEWINEGWIEVLPVEATS